MSTLFWASTPSLAGAIGIVSRQPRHPLKLLTDSLPIVLIRLSLYAEGEAFSDGFGSPVRGRIPR